MFSLIISIISIALVAALALATIYYGGDAFNKGSAQAKAAQLINEGQQISGAATLNATDAVSGEASLATDLAGLVTSGYLQQTPAGWALSGDLGTAGALIATEAVAPAVCESVNLRAGILTMEDGAVTGTVPNAESDASDKVYGCLEDNTVFYRL